MLRSEPSEPVVRTLRAAGCVFAEEEAALLTAAAGSAAELAELVGRRVGGQPLEHVLGWAEFDGRRWAVGPGVFVPRRRTEFLVGLASERAGAAPVVLDLCCGAGALGGAVAVRLGAAGGPAAGLYAADIDPAAAGYARRNLAPLGGEVFTGDLYAPLPAELRGRVDVLLANAPYVPTGEIGLLPAEARAYEPLVALDGGPDGLDVQRRVIAGAPDWLAPGGRLLIETGDHQAPATAEAFERAGLAAQVHSSEEWYATVVVGRRAPDGV